MYSVHIIPSRVLLPRDSAIFADLICRIPLQCCFRWLCLVVGLFGHLCAQYISVPLFYIVYTVHRCVFVLYRLWLLFLLAVYRMSVQSILIAYFYRCVQCTRYYCQCILFTHGNGLFVTVIYITCHHLHLANALSRSHNSLFRLFFTYRNYLAVPLIRPL